MQDTTILWADDEIDFLKPHILFLSEKGYQIKTATNGTDAVDLFKNNNIDLVFLDENMPGLTGLETLTEIKNINADVPIVMITKSEEEHLMEDAIGSKIDDYLIKPVNPKQILLTIKKLTENKRLVTAKTTMGYQQDFRTLGMTLNDNLSYQEWVDVYKKLIYWELELEKTGRCRNARHPDLAKGRSQYAVFQVYRKKLPQLDQKPGYGTNALSSAVQKEGFFAIKYNFAYVFYPD